MSIAVRHPRQQRRTAAFHQTGGRINEYVGRGLGAIHAKRSDSVVRNGAFHGTSLPPVLSTTKQNELNFVQHLKRF
jgi:hypothetical protein